MYKIGPPYSGPSNVTQAYSPVVFNREWPSLGRLTFIVCSSFLGSIVNGFFVSAFFIEDSLTRLGNVFHACVGLADMILTTVVMPIAGVVLLSGEWDVLPVCQFLQFLSEAAMYCYSLFFTLVAAENYYRICGTSRAYRMFISMGVGTMTMFMYTISFLVAGAGTFLGLDYDYCQRRQFGNYHFRTATFIIFYVIPFIITSYCLVATAAEIRGRARVLANYRRSRQYLKDYSITHLNIAAYVLNVLAWTPYLIVVNEFPGTTDSIYYQCAWIGIGRSLFTSCLYCSLNKNFRRAFAHLFFYCFCKSTLTTPFASRHRRALEYKVRTGQIRVHIMHPAMNVNSPQRLQRGTPAILETQDL